MPDKLISEKELCHLLGFTYPTIRAMREEPDDPDDPLPCLMDGKRRRYVYAQVIAWMERQTRRQQLMKRERARELAATSEEEE